MKLVGIVLIFLMSLTSCESSNNSTEYNRSYTVTYEVMYPSGNRQFTVQTSKGKAKIRKWHTGFFHGGPMVYSLIDERHKELAYEEFPIIIISQK